MKLITIQSIEVYKHLKNNNKYTVNNNAPIGSILIKPYQFMMKHYGYKHRPIFFCPVNYRCNFGGANTNNAVVFVLDIPDRYCKIQDYYAWSDFIYFTDSPNEYESFNNCKTVEQFGRYTLDYFKNGIINRSDIVYQVTTQMILKSWITNVEKLTDEFIDKYVYTGGVNILTY